MLKTISVPFVCALFVVSAVESIPTASGSSSIEVAEVIAYHRAYADKASQEKTDAEKLAEKLARLKGEKVTILGTKPLQCFPISDQVPFLFYSYEDNKREKLLSLNKYAGHTGAILEAKPTPGRGQKMEILIQLDRTGEKIIALSYRGLGFHSELAATAKALVGRSLWTKSRYTTIATISDPCKYYISEERLELKKFEKVTVTRVEFGDEDHPLFVFAKTEGGREGPIYELHFDTRFHELGSYLGSYGKSYTDEFLLDDPQKLHPTWSAAIWKLVQEGEVAIGMTEEMVKLACVDSMALGKLEEEGFVISPSGNEISTIYKCSGKRFVVEKGKVTNFVFKQ